MNRYQSLYVCCGSVLVLTFVFFSGMFPTPLSGAATISGLVHELHSLSYRAAERSNALSPDLERISPERGRFEDDLKTTLLRMSDVRSQIMSLIEADLEKGRSQTVYELCSAVRDVPPGEKSRRTLLLLCEAVKSKVRLADDRDVSFESRTRLLKALEDAEEPPSLAVESQDRPHTPIYIAFHWHMHQPVYWPGEDITKTESRKVYSFSLYDIFDSRKGVYTDWPANAVESSAVLPNGGVSLSFSGSLIDNLNSIGIVRPGFKNWNQSLSRARTLQTVLGNPRLDLTGFGYYHPLMPLISYSDMRLSISSHRKAIQDTFGATVAPSKGFFPPENAYSEKMIPALADEGFEWVIVDSIHLDRACRGYPWVKGENLIPPNPSEQRNSPVKHWVRLNGLWAPSMISDFSCRPHYTALIDPQTGQPAVTPEGNDARVIVVPGNRYLANEDSRGGFGVFDYESALKQLEPLNTDPEHPLLIVLHHDGDNYGGGTDSYYNERFQNVVSWVANSDERFVCTTIQDYLDRFPPDKNELVHVEPGSWTGADNGDPEFLKWNGDDDETLGYSPDRNSWAIITATRSIIDHCKGVAVEKQLKRSERFLQVAMTSCYEYWDGAEMWDSHPARACNRAVEHLMPLLSDLEADTVSPHVFPPQRDPYNPGACEWSDVPQDCDCTIWTYAYDPGEISTVDLQYRVHRGTRYPDPESPSYNSGQWYALEMIPEDIPSRTSPQPLAKATRYSADLCGIADSLVEYSVVATDTYGNMASTPIEYVYFGKGPLGDSGPLWEPEFPTRREKLTIWSDLRAHLRWSVDGNERPVEGYWPEGTVLLDDDRSVATPMVFDDLTGRYKIELGPFSVLEQKIDTLHCVFRFSDGSFGRDFRIQVK